LIVALKPVHQVIGILYFRWAHSPMRTSYVQLATDIFNEFTNTKHV